MESKEQDWDNSYVFQGARAHAYLAGQGALPHLSLSLVCSVFDTHNLIEMMTVIIGMMRMVVIEGMMGIM